MSRAAPRPLEQATVAVIGLGLLGGSLGLALAGRVARRIGVVEAGDTATAQQAVQLGVVDEVAALEPAVAAADVVVLATPVRTTLALLAQVAAAAGRGVVVTDVGSTKAAVVEAMSVLEAVEGCDAVFAGGHPMCGGTTPGLDAADAGLFEGATWAVCPTSGSSSDAATVHATDRVTALARVVGAVPLVVDAGAHDAAAALVSHLPRVVATSLVELLEPGSVAAALAGRGWHGATRLADGDQRMWDDVLATNGREVAGAARALAARLEAVARELEGGPVA